MKVGLIVVGLLLVTLRDAPAQDWPKESRKDSVKSSMDGTLQKFMYYRSTAAQPQPLIVSLHQWSSDYRSVKGSLVSQAIARDWNYVHPNFRGPNTTFEACGSDYVVQDIDDVIAWAGQHMPVDTNRIYVIGASGGGDAALSHLMKSPQNIRAYHAYVPITELENWYAESLARDTKYAQNIMDCTRSTDSLDVKIARERSPMHMNVHPDRLQPTRVHLFAGVHDGYTGAVPITHSLLFYNKLLDVLRAESNEAYIPPEDMIRLLSARSYPSSREEHVAGRKIHYHKNYLNLAVTIFEGGHELLEEKALDRLP